jgi:hypothetical protein
MSRNGSGGKTEDDEELCSPGRQHFLEFQSKGSDAPSVAIQLCITLSDWQLGYEQSLFEHRRLFLSSDLVILFNDVFRSDCVAINGGMLNIFGVCFTTLSACSSGLGRLRSRTVELMIADVLLSRKKRLRNIL